MKPKINWKIQYCRIIAEVHNLAKVWVSHTQYTIADSKIGAEILQLGYKTDITMIYY
jgi:hypothetical protein